MKFIFGKRPRNLKFEYVPRFYDEQKEDLDRRLGNYQGDMNDKEKVKGRISQGLRNKQFSNNSYKSKLVKKSNFTLIYIILILLLITYLFLKSDVLINFIHSIEGQK